MNNQRLRLGEARNDDKMSCSRLESRFSFVSFPKKVKNESSWTFCYSNFP